jgi:N-acyl amino acid synthase of PEP-CTERM/exosortase system
MKPYSVTDNFSQHFKICFADTKKLRQEAFKIRHKVYCEEMAWLPTNKNQMETDEYDDCAYHCLLQHRRSGVFSGCIRLVIPPANNPNFKLPFEKNSQHCLRKQVLDTDALPRGSFGEVSRLAVLPSFRQRVKEHSVPFVFSDQDPATVFTEQEKRNFPNIAMGLYLAAAAFADICNHSGVLVMMEPSLMGRLKQFGFPFIQVGDETQLYGTRALFYLKNEHYTSGLAPELKMLYHTIHEDLCDQMCLIPFTNAADR